MPDAQNTPPTPQLWEDSLKPKQIEFARLLAVGTSTQQAAKKLSISFSTAYRWGRDPTIKRLVQIYQADCWAASRSLLVAGQSAAISRLLKIIKSETSSDCDAVQASRIILNAPAVIPPQEPDLDPPRGDIWAQLARF